MNRRPIVPSVPESAESPRLLDTAGAAAFLSVSPATLATWRTRGGGPRFRKVGDSARLVRYAVSDLIAFAEAHPSQASTSDVAA